MTPEQPVTGLPVAPEAGGGNFLLWREVDRLERALADAGRRIDALDQHGSRGVGEIRLELTQLRQDLLDHEKQHKEAADQQRAARRWSVGTVIALVVPLYPLIWALVR